MRHLYTQPFTAAGAIAGKRLVALNDAGAAVQAAAAGNRIVGVADAVGAGAGGQVDVHMLGEQPVTAGGAILPGQPVTSDAQGRAVVAAPVAGTVIRIVGIATTVATQAGDIVQVFVLPTVASAAAA